MAHSPIRSKTVRGTADDSAAAQSDGVVAAIKTLIESLPTSEREKLLKELASELAASHRPFPAARAEQVMGTIIRLFPRDKVWTVDELKGKIADEGITAKPKEVYNAVGYLVRKGHIQRVGYGRYIVDGVEIVTADELGGASSRHEDEYRTRWAPQDKEEGT